MFGLAMVARLAFAAHAAMTPGHTDGKVIVRLASQHGAISVLSTENGVRYSATDKSGKTLVSNATLQDLKEQHPDLYRQVTPVFSATDAPIPYAGVAE